MSDERRKEIIDTIKGFTNKVDQANERLEKLIKTREDRREYNLFFDSFLNPDPNIIEAYFEEKNSGV
jgi:hypothetical protein